MKFVKLGDVCKVRNGYAFKSEKFSQDGIPLIRISDIQDNYVNPQKSARTTYEDIFENYKIIKGDILIAMSGATTGKFGIYNSDEVAYQNQRVGCFKIFDSNIINQTYLLQTLKVVKPIIEKKANGGAQPNISSSGIEEIQIPLPPLSDQIRIAEILSQAEALIAQRKESIALLDEYLKSTFLEMFGDPVRNEKGWKKMTGDDYLSKLTVGVVIKPASYYVDNGVIALRSLNIRPNKIELKNLVYFSKESHEKYLSKSILREGDVVFVRTGMTGTAAIIPKVLDGCNCIDLIITRPKANVVSPKYLVFFFNSDIGKKIVSSEEVGGIQKHFNIGALRKLSIPIPSFILQTKFANIAEKVDALKSQYQEGLLELQNMYAVLSQKAFKGELNLKENKPTTKVIAFEPEEGYHEKRTALACYIINQSLDDPQFGDVKFQKLLHLVDYDALKRNLNQKYYQKTAGPFDNTFTLQFMKDIEKNQWFTHEKTDAQSVFKSGKKYHEAINVDAYFSKDELAKIDQLIEGFKTCNYEEPEIISTLYAVWNNRIIKQETITDDLLKADFLKWDSQKKKYIKRLDNGLAWMRKNNIIPDGWGKLIEKPKGKK